MATEFRSEKISRNRLRMVFVIPQKKVVIPRHSEIYGRVNSEARNRTEFHEKNGFKKILLQKQNWQRVFTKTCFGTEFREFASFLFHGTEFWVGFSSGELFRTKFWEFASILFHGPEYLAFFSSAKWFGAEFREFSVQRSRLNSAETNKFFHLFRLPRNNFLVGNCQPKLGVGGVTPSPLTTNLFHLDLVDILFQDDVTVILPIGYFFHSVPPPTDGICQV